MHSVNSSGNSKTWGHQQTPSKNFFRVEFVQNVYFERIVSKPNTREIKKPHGKRKTSFNGKTLNSETETNICNETLRKTGKEKRHKVQNS